MVISKIKQFEQSTYLVLIMNTLLNFNNSRLLKDIGFNLDDCNQGWFANFGDLNDDTYEFLGTYTFLNIQTRNDREWEIQAPTIADVVMWLFDKHKIWIYIRPILNEDGEWIFKGYVKFMHNFKAKEYQTNLLISPTETYVAAIEYTLKNLL
jgi:hypothetical protein